MNNFNVEFKSGGGLLDNDLRHELFEITAGQVHTLTLEHTQIWCGIVMF